MWDEITYPFPNVNDATVEVWEWISNFILHFIMDVITYPCMYTGLALIIHADVLPTNDGRPLVGTMLSTMLHMILYKVSWPLLISNTSMKTKYSSQGNDVVKTLQWRRMRNNSSIFFTLGRHQRRGILSFHSSACLSVRLSIPNDVTALNLLGFQLSAWNLVGWCTVTWSRYAI